MATSNAINANTAGLVKYDGSGTFSGETTTQYNVQVGAASNGLTSVAPSATSGVPLVSQGASADPAFGTAVVAGGGTGAVTLTGIVTGNGTSAMTASTVTQYGVLVGGASNAVSSTAVGSAGQVLQSAGAGADPAYSTATYPLTTTINQVLYSSAANTVTGLATANKAVMTTGATGVPVMTALATDGQLIIGSTAGAPAAATLTAGTGIGIANAGNSITISNTGATFTWNDVTGTTDDFVADNGYIANNAGLVTITLPATATVGDSFKITGLGAGGWKIAQNASQLIHMGSSVTTTGTGGSLASTNQYDSLEFVCVVTNTTYNVINSVGNITIV